MLADDGRDIRKWRDVERRVPRREAAGHLGRIALLDRDRGTVGGGEVDGRSRRDDDERDAVMRSEHGETVRADLVRRVAVARDPVGAGDDQIDLAATLMAGVLMAAGANRLLGADPAFAWLIALLLAGG